MSGGAVSITALLDAIETASNIKDRNQALADFRRILRHNLPGSTVQNTKEDPFQQIFVRLFQIISVDLPGWLKSKKSANDGRLLGCAGALRLAVEVGVRRLKGKHVKLLVKHLTKDLMAPTGGLCAPLALDYAKALHVLATYQPHIEHLSRTEWEHMASFCIKVAQVHPDTVDNRHDSDDQNTPNSSRANVMSYRSSRSARDSQASQSQAATLDKNVAVELIECLHLLTSVPNAVFKNQASLLMWALIDILKNAASRKCHIPALRSVNNLLAWLRTEDSALVQASMPHLVRLVKQFWAQKSTNTPAKDDMIITLAYVQPYIEKAMQGNSASVMTPELSWLADTLRNEYVGRQPREQLHLGDLTLIQTSIRSQVNDQIRMSLFGLGSSGNRPESSWAVLDTLASLYKMIESPSVTSDHTDDDSGREALRRPVKRQKTSTEWEELLTATDTGEMQPRIATVQILVFLLEKRHFSKRGLSRLLDVFTRNCSHEDGTIVSWSFHAISSCVAQASSQSPSLTQRWTTIWQIATRSMVNPSTCRAACHLLVLMLRVRLVDNSVLTEFIQSLSVSVDFRGPKTLTDSVCHLLDCLLRRSAELTPGSTSLLAENILRWCLRTTVATTSEDKPANTGQVQYQALDLVRLLLTCVGHDTSMPVGSDFFAWEKVALAIVRCKEQSSTISYVLLLPDYQSHLHPALCAGNAPEQDALTKTRVVCETAVLTHFIAEMQRERTLWTDWTKSGTTPGIDLFRMLLTNCCVATVLAYDTRYQDQRSQDMLKNEVSNMLRTLSRYIASDQCDEDKLEAAIATLYQTCVMIPETDTDTSISTGQKVLCSFLHKALGQRREAANDGKFDINDMMDLDDDSDSQESRQVTRKVIDDIEIMRTDGSVMHSRVALQTSVTLYAAIVAALADDETPDAAREASRMITNHITGLSGSQLSAARPVLCALTLLGLQLSASETERLFEHCTEVIMDPYGYRRSEAALGTMLDFMSSVLHLWTDQGNESLHELGLELYSWFAKTAATAGVFSPNVEKRLATLLLRIIHADPAYGEDKSEDADLGINTRLFKLIQIATVEVQYFVGSRISSILGLFTLPQHESILYDLEQRLPNDTRQVEDMAIRLLFFAQLGQSWHTILRQCVYHIFETAGRVPTTQGHAARCLAMLASSLKFESPRRLFRLFASQLVYTWLETNDLSGLPFSCFQYESLQALIAENKIEIFAQLICLENNESSIEAVTTACQMTRAEVARLAFARAQTYALSWDVQDSGVGGKHVSVRENRLQDTLGSKEQLRGLCREQFAAIMGRYYLTLQLSKKQKRVRRSEGDTSANDDLWWLKRKESHHAAATAIQEMLMYGCSTQDLPTDQQPSFRPSFLIDNIARLCRRTGHDPVQPWEPRTFALAARMLIDSTDESLGPLHITLMLRRLRVLIAMAGDVPFAGHPLEILLHSVRPYLSVEECADDALGILRYLMTHGEAYLTSDIPGTIGLILLMVLQMSQYSQGRQSATTQESQFRITTGKMKVFRSWLMEYVGRLKRALDDVSEPLTPSVKSACATLIQNLPGLSLPGNASDKTHESQILEFILADTTSKRPILGHTTCIAALRILTKNFVAPKTVGEDSMASDHKCRSYAASIYKVLQEGSWDKGFLLWALTVLGRAYASSGTKETPASRSSPHIATAGKDDVPLEGSSESHIVGFLVRLILSNIPKSSGLAEYTLRKAYGGICERADLAPEAERFMHILPVALREAIDGGIQGYRPTTVEESASTGNRLATVQHALGVRHEQDGSTWITELLVSLCEYATSFSPLLAALPAALVSIPGLAADLAPHIVHILLLQDDENSLIKQEISSSMTMHFKERDVRLQKRQESFLNTLLYLRGQPYPRESNPTDRLKWLSIDYTLAAEAAAHCSMPTTALLLAESGCIPTVDTARRASARRSLSQATFVAQIPPHLLLLVYEGIDEPDSFYGVQQSASMDSMLSRLDYEGNGQRSLMFRSAQMDAAMRKEHRLAPETSAGMFRSLTALSFNGLAFALTSGPMTGAIDHTGDMLRTAQKLQQWDLGAPLDTNQPEVTSFAALQHLSRTTDLPVSKNQIASLLVEHVNTLSVKKNHLSTEWWSSLASLTEIRDVLHGFGEDHMQASWDRMVARQTWMDTAPIEDSNSLVSNRQTLFSVIAQNNALMEALHVSSQSSRLLEAKSLVRYSQFSRSHGAVQEALSSASQLTVLASRAAQFGISLAAAANLETASVLWDIGEASASVHMLRDILESSGAENESIPIGRSGLLAQLGYQLADARLEKPDVILQECLEPAIKHLEERIEGKEAGMVFYAYATFCDRQLQSPAAMEDLRRIASLRQKKEEEKQELEQMIRKRGSGSKEKDGLSRSYDQAKKWFKIDDEEYQRLLASRHTFAKQSLHYYLLSLTASDEHNISALRFFALWLENSEVDEANDMVHTHLPGVPSWKFVLLLNQLMSRLEKDRSTFQTSLKALVARICEGHPYHSLHHLFASTRPSPNMSAPASSRYEAAAIIRRSLEANSRIGELLTRFFRADNLYHKLAGLAPPTKESLKISMRQWPEAKGLVDKALSLKLPPATVSLPLRADGNYQDAPVNIRFDSDISIMGGISAPKALRSRASNGLEYRQLFKGGNDDLRQDAIMEQVFEEVSKMLGNHKATRQRNLRVRTYKVIPLTPSSGIIEFVPNSVPFDIVLQKLHRKYHPQDLSPNLASNRIGNVSSRSPEERLKEYRRICDQMHPVLRHHLFEKYQNPDEWFAKRTAYTRSTAAVSMMGHVIGLGDRHNSNILLDEKTGEVVHIDLGISFEAGKVLPVPETVPFRLTRDVVDAMGVTKTEGIFRRCCEFTMDALREDKDSIMTLLNVLRYDPLHNWTLSPVRARRAQNASETNPANGAVAGVEVQSSKRKEQETAEANRALAVVERKLARTLSTAATVNELIQQATDEKNLAVLFRGWAAYF